MSKMNYKVATVLTILIVVSFWCWNGFRNKNSLEYDYTASVAGILDSQYPVISLTFSPDDSMLAAVYLDCTVKVWATKNWQLLATIKQDDIYPYAYDAKETYSPSIRTELSFISSTTLMFSWMEPHSGHKPILRLIDIESETVLDNIPLDANADGVYFSRNPAKVFGVKSYGSDQETQFFVLNVQSQAFSDPQVLFELPWFYKRYDDGRISSDGTAYYSFQPPNLYKFLVAEKDVVASVTTFTYVSANAIRCYDKLYLSKMGRYAALPNRIKNNRRPYPSEIFDRSSVAVMDLHVGNVVAILKDAMPVVAMDFLEHHEKLITSMAPYWGCGEDVANSRMVQGVLKIWDIPRGKTMAILSDKTAAIWSLDVSNNEEYIVAGNVYGVISVWKFKGNSVDLVKKL